MRFFRMFLLHCQQVFEYRGRSLVWFIISLVGPLTMILFWNGAAQSSHGQLQFATIASYYLLLIPIGTALTSHVDEDIAYDDIKDGQLTRYLTRPVSFYWIKFLEEVPNRLLQGLYGVLIILGISFFFPSITLFSQNPFSIVLTCIILFLGYLMSFTYKILIGFVAFWLTDIGGFLQFENMLWYILTGYLMPLSLLPQWLGNIALVSPFSYMLYYPLLAVQGSLPITQLLFTIFIQLCWMGIMLLFYQILWTMGIKKYTAVGQ